MVELRTVRVGDLGRVVTGKTPPSAQPELFGADYPFLTPTDIDGAARYIEPERFLSPKGRDYQQRMMLPARAVCVVCIGATIGKVCMTGRPSFTNQQINSVVVNEDEHDPFFVYHLMTTLRDELKANAGGAATPIINKTAFSEIEISVPPLPVQQRIAGILSAYDELIENSQRRIRILEAMAGALYREWFVHFRFPGHEKLLRVASSLGDIPQGWKVKRIDEALSFESGRTIKREDRENGATPVYGANGIIGGTANPPMADRCIIMGKIGSCGARHRSHKPCWVTNNAFLIQPRAIQSRELSWQVLLDIDFRQYIGGAANPYMPLNSFGQHEVLVAPASLQAEFEKRSGPLRRLVETLFDRIQNLRQTRDLLLPRLLSGQVPFASEIENIPETTT